MTVRSPTGDRGQTTQDFAVGISIFLLTVTFVFAFVPGLGSPLQRGVDAQQRAGADRIAAHIVSSYSLPGQPNTLDASEATDFFEGTTAADLKDRFGLPSYVDVNVTIRHLNGSIVEYDGGNEAFALGPDAAEENAAEARRVVEMNAHGCRDGCVLVVRVW